MKMLEHMPIMKTNYTKHVRIVPVVVVAVVVVVH